MESVERLGALDKVLDFGCGSGAMLPFLSERSQHVTAIDLDLAAIERIQKHVPLSKNVKVEDPSKTSLKDLPAGSFELIIALDVLEHVHDLPGILSEIVALLKPRGRLIVSGPTENILYRVGRKVAGPEYSGAYHERGVAAIKNELARRTRIEPIATLYWPISLFEIFAAVA
jgi:2-polyprenyl-3-methyl-5-hydroxy-6-metoxy-1,4-benzoquinol methylase